jgi:membrane-associated phospholipid phosphatase
MSKLKCYILFCFLILFTNNSVQAQNFEVKMLHSIHVDSSIFKNKMSKGLSFSAAPIAIATPATLILTGFINKDDAMKREGYRAGATFVLSSALTVGLKYSINRKRPFAKHPDLFHQKSHVGPYSFPSGHTSTAFATATSLTLATKKWYVAVPAYAWASGVAYSRMYLGVHYPSDILGGMVIGIGSGFLVWKVDQWLQKK